MLRNKRIQNRRPARNGRKGNSLVEMSLVLTILIVVITGTIEVASIMYSYQLMNENVRRAARYAVVNTYDADAIKNMVVYGNTAGSGTAYYGASLDAVDVSLTTLDAVNSLLTIEVSPTSGKYYTPFLGAIPTPRIRVARVVEGLGSSG